MISLNEIVRQYPSWMQQSGFHDQMVKEYLHYYMLRILFQGRYAGKISFIGGTALRYFYDIKRFSEDLDFDCFDLKKEDFNKMTDDVLKGIGQLGNEVLIEDKEKYGRLNAYRRVFVFPELKYKLGISQQKEAKFFTKIEAEPQGYEYTPEVKMLNGFGVSTSVRIMPLNILFSTKVAAAVTRKKDRDFYDVISLIDFAKPDFSYLSYKCQINTPEELRQALLNAAAVKKLETRRLYDCTHMLFNKSETEKLRSFTEYIRNFDFNK